jgi:dUTP pyrophosphatase
VEVRGIPKAAEFKNWAKTVKELAIVIVAKSEELLPVIKYSSNGLDCRADLKDQVLVKEGDNSRGALPLRPFARALIPLGFKVYMPRDCFMDIRPRSGLAWNSGITILNSPGFVDNDYRDTVKALLINLSKQWFYVNHGDRICQAVFSKDYPLYVGANKEIFDRFDEFFSSSRGKRGFGSTGVK